MEEEKIKSGSDGEQKPLDPEWFADVYHDSLKDAKLQQQELSAKSSPSTLRRTISITILIILSVILLSLLGLDKKIIGLFAILVGLIAQIFTGLVGLIGLMPIVGPIIVKVIALPLFLLINGVASLISIMMVRKGMVKDVVASKKLAIAFVAGLAIGLAIGLLV